MRDLIITGIGDVKADIDEALSINEINLIKNIKKINQGKLGNFRTFTYRIDFNIENTIDVRNLLVKELSKYCKVMFNGTDWMDIYVFPRHAFAQ